MEVQYFPGEFDSTISPGSDFLTAKIVGNGNDIVIGEKTIETKNLVVFTNTEVMVASRINVPSESDRIGQHPYYKVPGRDAHPVENPLDNNPS